MELVLTRTNMVPLIVKCVHSDMLVKTMVVQVLNHVEHADVVSGATNLQTWTAGVLSVKCVQAVVIPVMRV